MNYEFLQLAKDCYLTVASMCDRLEVKGYYDGKVNGCHFSDLFRLEIAKYIAYVMASDGKLTQAELDVFKFITGYNNESVQSINSFIQNAGILKPNFRTDVPYFVQFLVHAFNNLLDTVDGDVNTPKKSTYKSLIMTYILIGLVVSEADGSVYHAEKREFLEYVRNVEAYINDASYLIVDEDLKYAFDVFRDHL